MRCSGWSTENIEDRYDQAFFPIRIHGVVDSRGHVGDSAGIESGSACARVQAGGFRWPAALTVRLQGEASRSPRVLSRSLHTS